MSREEIICVQERFIDAVNSNELDRLNDLVSPNVIDNDPVTGQVPGPQGYIRFFRSLRRAFPDMSIDVEQIVADEDDSVGFVYTFSGTHTGDYFGVSGTGKNVQIKGMQISHFEQGKMTERWGNWDEHSILQQIGLLVAS
jgi:steroid delta-isomerase-like uncharacterized protein